MIRRAASVSLIALSFALSATAALAGRFSDVPTSHVYHDAIERLATNGVVTGNPDGTFAPGKVVNRAEFLTMLYRARGLTPSGNVVCLRDVIAGSWYLPVVCDAVRRGFAGGYSDGTFRAQNPVNRVEAAKMLLLVLDLPIGDVSESDRPTLSQYSDISLDVWYSKFLAALFRLGILPVAGTSTTTFGPQAPLTRAEAAAYIDSAIRVEAVNHSASSSSSVASTEQSSSAMTRSSKSSTSSSSGPAVKQRTYPFEDAAMFVGTSTMIYRYSLSAKTVGEFTVTVPDKEHSVSCTLYKLGSDSLPTEYYAGSPDDGKCFLRVAMPSGDYQLDVRSPNSPSFALTSRVVQGDGNDGFSEAKTLVANKTKVGVIEVDDHADYYTFTVLTPGTWMVETSNSARTRCVIVPLADVDLFGFSSPACDASFAYTTGTYIVILDREPALSWKEETYGVVLKQQ